jgi:hypothetical protein
MIVRIRFQRPDKGALFVHPMDPAPRTAILAPGFQPTKTARVFPRGWCELAARFQPQSIAASLVDLRRLAAQGLRLEHAVIAFTFEGEDGLSSADRELFWRGFGVPVFEQLLDSRNRLLAMECDAHSGLHVLGGCQDLRLEREPCACGDRSPRISRGARVDELVELLA